MIPHRYGQGENVVNGQLGLTKNVTTPLQEPVALVAVCRTQIVIFTGLALVPVLASVIKEAFDKPKDPPIDLTADPETIKNQIRELTRQL